ncbi:BBP7 family outer membrane beta-barrel protein [Aeoliella mucimassa]|uniref:Uncharacterized protein n=1 Tax=Aeoliella mucimassa TaxID=2527972 RepID=A0A518ASM6_9BACT|nr:BBP7 family outer membrane beta-barrel protein [Aeoliella mucimassa]QDU57687.1 hypothetical protein Pan181_39080 [Aeoliella mucimassa]
MESSPRFNVRIQLANCMAAAVVLCGVSLMPAEAQPLQWSPQRNAQPIRSLEQLAAESVQPAAYHAPAPTLMPTPANPGTGAMQQAILIRNPNTSDGTPEFALADQYGTVQRYVEQNGGIDLQSYVGERVAVRSDTGDTLLATQLLLPSMQPTSAYPVQQAEHQQAVKPLQANSPTLRTAQVAPVVIDDYGTVSTNCPNCNGGQYIGPSIGGMVNSYDGCQTCGPYYLMPQTSFGPSCGRGARGQFYGSAEWLLWWFDGMYAPPLVTTSPNGTAQADAGVLGEPGTQVLFGGGDILDGSRNGMKFTLGTWFNDYQDIALEGDAFFFETDSVGFGATGSGGSPILARPFFNMAPIDGVGDPLVAAEDAELVSFPNVVEGTVSVYANSEFNGAGLRLRKAICCKEIGGTCTSCNPCMPVVSPSCVSRIDFIGGYRYLSLDERILVRENLNSLLTASPGTFDLYDRFDTSNEFHGGDLGFIWEWESQKWTLSLLSKVALGNTHQRVNVAGQTTVSDGTNSYTEEGGLLALQSNIGTYKRDVFSAIPEIGAKLGYKITPRLQATVGYTLLYWGNVARPGEHIDLDVNPNLLPPVTPPVEGASRPRFEWHDSPLLAHGLNVGLDYRF